MSVQSGGTGLGIERIERNSKFTVPFFYSCLILIRNMMQIVLEICVEQCLNLLQDYRKTEYLLGSLKEESPRKLRKN